MIEIKIDDEIYTEEQYTKELEKKYLATFAENEGLKERIKAVIECKGELDKYNTELTADNNSIITENEKLKEKLKDVTECKNELLEENQRLLRMLEENGLLEIADDLERV